MKGVLLVFCAVVAPAVAAEARALTQSAMPAAGCAWAGETDQRDVNVGAPDLDAYYWMDTLSPVRGTSVQIQGHYPRARYFSFHVYDSAGDALTSIYDAQITAAPGNGNPFRHRVNGQTGDAYSVRLVWASPPPQRAPNTLYVNPQQVGQVALVVYRVYVPQRASDPSGGVGFPAVTTVGSTGTPVLAQAGCATTPPAFGSAIWSAFAQADYPSFAPTPAVSGANRIPSWQRSFGSKLGNQQNAYLGAIISRQLGQLVVIHARVPTFPDTRRNQPVYGRQHQVRYWSFCTYDAQGEAGFGCAADYRAVIRRGYVTYVISDPGLRPRNATRAAGVTWLPWGGDQYSAQVVLRNMLPSVRFHHAVQAITPTSDPSRVMAAYYPRSAYCSVSTFQRGGWRACFASAGLAPDGP